jgi:iron(III) transport system substrate-binding protein
LNDGARSVIVSSWNTADNVEDGRPTTCSRLPDDLLMRDAQPAQNVLHVERPTIVAAGRVAAALRAAVLAAASSCSLLVAGCWSDTPKDVVVYAALDSEFSQPILGEFAAETGLNPLPKFDVESTKTVGLANALLAEKERPRADVFWNNEILNTLRLRDAGLLEPYASPVGKEYPPQFRAADDSWHGFAARARVLIVNTKLVPETERPSSIYDMTKEKWRGKIGIAKPLFGTTATHAACLFAVLGEEKAVEFFKSLRDNEVQIVAGNKQVALGVASGQLAFGLTDTDDAIIELEGGQPVAIVYPDSAPDQLGTLFIPNTIAVIKGCPHPEAAKRLVDYVLRAETEEKLAAGPSAQIPLHPKAKPQTRIATPQTVKAMPVDFEAAAKNWETAAKFIREQFATN